MKIAFISAMASHPWGGSENLWAGAARELRAMGHEVAACVKGWPETHPTIKELATLGVHILERRPRVVTKWESRRERVMRRIKTPPPEPDPVRQWLIESQPDLVCVSNGNFKDGFTYLELLRNLDVPYVSLMQANAEFLWPDDPEADQLRDMYSHAVEVHGVSKANIDLLQSQLGIRLPRSRVVWNPYNLTGDLPVAWPEGNDEVRLACVARLEPAAKGQDLLLHVLAQPEWKNRNIKISFFGTGSAERGVRQLAETLGVIDKVIFAGHVASVRAIWESHHALVLPSRYEGLPLALIEAMLCARVPIVTDVAGNCEIIENGVSGFCATAPTARWLSEAMESAWKRKDEWPEIGMRAHESLKSRIPKSPLRAYADILLELAESTSRQQT